MKTLLEGVGDCGLHRGTPYAVQNVSYSQLSIARHTGCIRFNGDLYTYFPDTDELIRNDVLAWMRKRDRLENAKKLSEKMIEEERNLL